VAFKAKISQIIDVGIGTIAIKVCNLPVFYVFDTAKAKANAALAATTTQYFVPNAIWDTLSRSAWPILCLRNLLLHVVILLSVERRPKNQSFLAQFLRITQGGYWNRRGSFAAGLHLLTHFFGLCAKSLVDTRSSQVQPLRSGFHGSPSAFRITGTALIEVQERSHRDGHLTKDGGAPVRIRRSKLWVIIWVINSSKSFKNYPKVQQTLSMRQGDFV
jgi:hypothetical protein